MNNTQVETGVSDNNVIEQTGFWLKIVDGWKREIDRVVEKSESVDASPEITAEVAKTAGELSVLAEQLEDLSALIGCHKSQIPVEVEPDWKNRHEYLNEKLLTEGQKFRTLLSEMFKLDKAAYRRFLC